MEKEQFVKAALAIILIIVLLIVPQKITDIYRAFMGIGEEESSELTQLRADCTKLADANEDIGRCALEVAEETLKAKEDLIIVEKWLRIQIDKGSSGYFKECLDFGRNILYPQSKDWAGAVETYNIIYNKWNNDEVKLAIDEATINIDVEKIFKVYDELKLAGSGNYDFNRNIMNQNYNLLETSLKDAVGIYQKNKGKLSDVPLLKTGETCNTKYGSTELWLPSCIYLSRVSLGIGCYLDASQPTDISKMPKGSCKSCAEYSIESLAPKIDICSGYHNQKTCEADPCDKSSCKWMGNRCEAVLGFDNYWDLN